MRADFIFTVVHRVPCIAVRRPHPVPFRPFPRRPQSRYFHFFFVRVLEHIYTYFVVSLRYGSDGGIHIYFFFRIFWRMHAVVSVDRACDIIYVDFIIYVDI